MDDDREEKITDLSLQRSRSGREDRADYLEEERVSRARDLAFEEGRRRERVDGRLSSHESRLNAINGSVKEHARNAAELRDSVNILGDKVESVITTLNMRAELEKERVSQLRTANEKQISGRTFWLGVIAVIVPIVALIITVLQQAHGL